MLTAFMVLMQFILLVNINYGKIESFPELDGLQKSGEVEIFNPDNLFDYINGAADSYLNYDFVELKLQRYIGLPDQSVKIEIYQHSTPSNAFGIYSIERPIEGNWISIGGQGYYENETLNFYSGIYYVKLISYKISNAENLLIKTAKKIEELLNTEGAPLEIFNLFPSVGKVSNSEKYINKNFLGYESLNGAYLAEYSIGDDNFDLFLMKKKDSKECKKMLVDYFSSVNLDTSKIDEGKIIVKDPYQGEYQFFWNDNFIIGAINYNDVSIVDKYIEMMKKRLH